MSVSLCFHPHLCWKCTCRRFWAPTAVLLTTQNSGCPRATKVATRVHAWAAAPQLLGQAYWLCPGGHAATTLSLGLCHLPGGDSAPREQEASVTCLLIDSRARVGELPGGAAEEQRPESRGPLCAVPCVREREAKVACTPSVLFGESPRRK